MQPPAFPFALKMPFSMKMVRELRGVRAAMLVAACLAAAAGFGLHPEPVPSDVTRGVSLHDATVSEGGTASHDCLACRAHRPLVAAHVPAEVSGPAASTALLAAPGVSAIRVFPLLRLDGRSPPATS